MIYTVTFNPSLDYVMQIGKFRIGEVNRSEKENVMPGGKGINVSLVLKQFQVPSVALGFVGGFTGNEIARLLSERGISPDFVRVKAGSSRINVKVHAETETEINGAGPYVDAESLEILMHKIENLHMDDTLVLAGSVPKGVPKSIYADIAKQISSKKVKLIVDAEKELLASVLSFNPFLIKPNHKEMAAFFDCEIKTKADVKKYALLLKENGAQNVLVSMAGDGAVLAAADGNVYFCDAPKGNVVHSTGAGDSMVAGFLYAKENAFSDKDALRFAICAGSASAFSEDLACSRDILALFKNTDNSFVEIL